MPMETIQASFDYLIREKPMGQSQARKDALKLEFHGTKVTSGAGLLTWQAQRTCLGTGKELMGASHKAAEFRSIRSNTQNRIWAWQLQVIDSTSYGLILLVFNKSPMREVFKAFLIKDLKEKHSILTIQIFFFTCQLRDVVVCYVP